MTEKQARSQTSKAPRTHIEDLLSSVETLSEADASLVYGGMPKQPDSPQGITNTESTCTARDPLQGPDRDYSHD